MTKYTVWEQRLVVRVLKEVVDRRLACSKGHCLLSVQTVTKAVANDRRVVRAGLSKSKTMSQCVLDLLRESNLVLEEWGHTCGHDSKYTSDLHLIFSVEGIINDEGRGSLSSSFQRTRVKFAWPSSPSSEEQLGGIVNASDCD